MNFRFPVLIGDIGGTNARFAVVGAGSEPGSVRVDRLDPVRLADFAEVEQAIEAALRFYAGPPIATILFAIATPLVGERFRLTNAPWTIDPQSMMAHFGLGEVVLMNDFAAQGLAALALSPEHLVPIGGGEILADRPKVAIGPGTGLGIAIIVKVSGRWAVIPGEGGHIDLGPRTAREMAIWPHLAKEDGRMSAELALSGRGLENLFRAIRRTDGLGADECDAAEISKRAIQHSDVRAREAVDLFLTLFARVAGDMALLTLARGGIYVAGGIILKLLADLDHARFRADFEDKGPHQGIMADIAVNVMTHPTSALEGLAAWVQAPDQFGLEGATRRFRPPPA